MNSGSSSSCGAGKRLLGLTEPGQELVGIVERILLDTQNIKRLGEQFSNKDKGQLSVATTHTQARYALPSVVTEFKKAFPKVSLVLHEASPSEIASMLISGQADIGIATEALQNVPELATFPYYSWHHGVIVPVGHALDSGKKFRSKDRRICRSSPITAASPAVRIDEAFDAARIVPDIAMTALDADVIKTYVELGLGVGIVASMAFDNQRDPHLSCSRPVICLRRIPHGSPSAAADTCAVLRIASLNFARRHWSRPRSAPSSAPSP